MVVNPTTADNFTSVFKLNNGKSVLRLNGGSLLSQFRKLDSLSVVRAYRSSVYGLLVFWLQIAI